MRPKGGKGLKISIILIQKLNLNEVLVAKAFKGNIGPILGLVYCCETLIYTNKGGTYYNLERSYNPIDYRLVNT